MHTIAPIQFEQAPVSKAVLSMAMPTIASSLVMVLYNLADTYFVGMLNNPVQNAAVTRQRRCCWPLMPSTICSALGPPA